MIIYKTTNKINNKIYIGQDSNNDPNYLGSGTVILNSIKKHGKENFIKEILDFGNDMDELNEKEIYWIKYYNATDPLIGYNLMTGGGQNGKHSAASKKK